MITAYFDSSAPSKALKVTKKYKTLEILAVEARLDDNEVIFMMVVMMLYRMMMFL